MIYQLRQEVDYLKKVVLGHGNAPVRQLHAAGMQPQERREEADWQDADVSEVPQTFSGRVIHLGEGPERLVDEQQQEDSLSLQKAGSDLIKKALDKYKGNRKQAAAELGISERTLYRKLKNIND